MNLEKFWKNLFGYRIGDKVKLKKNLKWSKKFPIIKKGTQGKIVSQYNNWAERKGNYIILHVEFQISPGIWLNVILEPYEVDLI